MTTIFEENISSILDNNSAISLGRRGGYTCNWLLSLDFGKEVRVIFLNFTFKG